LFFFCYSGISSHVIAMFFPLLQQSVFSNNKGRSNRIS